jgi:hypothetical protein
MTPLKKKIHQNQMFKISCHSVYEVSATHRERKIERAQHFLYWGEHTGGMSPPAVYLLYFCRLFELLPVTMPAGRVRGKGWGGGEVDCLLLYLV